MNISKKWMLLMVVIVMHLGKFQSSANPKVLSFPLENLVESKVKYEQGEPAIKAVVDQLLVDADKALEKPALSVMDKSSVADSGDKHDYYSVAPYWWPNPDTKDGLPYINKDGVWNYDERKKTDSDALSQICNNSQILGLAYYFTGNEKYAKKIKELIKVWFFDSDTKMNPNLEYGQAIKGRRSGSPSGGVLEGLGFTKLLDGVTLIEGSDVWSQKDSDALRSWFTEYNTWLHESEFGKAAATPTNNIGTWYHVQAAYIYLYLGQKEKAQELVKSGFNMLLDLQFSAKGEQPKESRRTKSFSYYVYNLNAWCELAIVAKQAGFDGWNYQTEGKRSLRKGLLFMIPYANPKEPWIKKDINSPSRQSLMRPFALAAQFCEDPQVFKDALKYRDKESHPRWVLWVKLS